MGEKASAPGHFMIPTSPAAGIACAQSASANTFGTLTQIIASTVAALLITGIYVEVIAAANLPTYVAVEIAVVASTIVDMMNVPLGPTSGVAATQWGVYKPIFPPIPVANATKILAATASSVASAISYLITLECVAVTNVVDDGVAETSNLTQIGGAAISGPVAAGVLDVNVKNYNNQAAVTDAANLPKVDTEDWKGGVVPAVTVTGVPKVDVADWLGGAPNALAAGRVDSSVGAIVAGQVVFKKNVAFANFMFQMLLSDHYTPATGIVVTATRAIDGGAFGACTNSGTIAEIASGWYSINLSTTDLNGGNIALHFTGAGCDAANFLIVTQP